MADRPASPVPEEGKKTTGVTGLSDPIISRMVAEDKVPWYKKPNLRRLYFLLFPACMGIEMTSGFDSQMINSLQFIPPWNKYFGRPDPNPANGYTLTPQMLGLVSACYSLGAIVGLPFIGAFNQRFGRRWSIMFGSWVMVAGALIQGFSVHIAMYIIARMLLGFGIVFCIVAGSAMIGELGYPKERPVLTSLFNSSYFFGSIIASGIALGTSKLTNNWAWRIPSLLQMAPSILQIIAVFFLPESPRHLISKDRIEEAYDVLVKYHAEGDRDSLFVKAEMAQIQATIALELEASKQSWWDMVATPGMRRRTLIASMLGLFTQWSGNTLISYYLSPILNLLGIKDSYRKNRINIGNNCWGLVNGTLAAFIAPRMKRRTMFLTSTISMLCVYIAWTITLERSITSSDNGHLNKVASGFTLFFIFLYSPAYNIGNNALTYTYLVELFPFAQRARGISIEQLFGRLAGFFTTYVNSIALDAISWKYLIVYCCWIVFEITFVYFMYPETSGRTLEELTFLFEDQTLANQATIAVEKQIHHEDNSPDEQKKQQIVHVESA
ncbi:general substrate transporter [Xylogone sp. PMI_703]|nr:general substrate transporter [Xylogone sp. PMI_703]